MPTLKRQIDIDAPTSDVWHVLTTRDLVREWAAAFADEIDVIGGLRPGARVTWRAPDQPDRRGVVAVMDADRSLRIDYAEGEGPFRTEVYEVRPVDGGARLSAVLTLQDPATAEALDAALEAALARVRSLAQELAWIRGRRPVQD